MKALRSIGIFLIVCAALCGLVSYECYRRAVNTARAVADTLEGIEFVSVAIPVETQVAAFVGVMLLVAGVMCLLNARQLADRGQPL